MKLLAPLSTALLVVAPALAAAPARAEDGEWALSLGPSYRGLAESAGDDGDAYRSVVGVLGRVRYGLGDFFQLGAALDLGVGLPTAHSDVAPVGALAFEAHYVIDIVTWVPFVTLGAGLLFRGDAPDDRDGDVVNVSPFVTPDVIVSLGGGLEYRPARDWGLGFSGRYDLVVTDFADTDAFQLGLFYTTFFE